MNTNQTNQIELIDKIGDLISNNVYPQLRLDQTPWNADQCARYLGVSKKYFMATYAPLPDFPKAGQLPRPGGKGNVKWIAQDVVDWTLKYIKGGKKIRSV